MGQQFIVRSKDLLHHLKLRTVVYDGVPISRKRASDGTAVFEVTSDDVVLELIVKRASKENDNGDVNMKMTRVYCPTNKTTATNRNRASKKNENAVIEKDDPPCKRAETIASFTAMHSSIAANILRGKRTMHPSKHPCEDGDTFATTPGNAAANISIEDESFSRFVSRMKRHGNDDKNGWGHGVPSIETARRSPHERIRRGGSIVARRENETTV